MYVNHNNLTYFDGFGVEHIPKETRKFIGIISFMLKGRSLLEYRNLFFSDYEKNDKIILKYF